MLAAWLNLPRIPLGRERGKIGSQKQAKAWLAVNVRGNFHGRYQGENVRFVVNVEFWFLKKVLD